MTWRIQLQGQVQGVGFRPFVWQLAIARGLKGWVANGVQGVEIILNGTETAVVDFKDLILENPPPLARITRHSITPVSAMFFDNFTIKSSDQAGEATLLLTPDTALCTACRTELETPGNRRFHYPFTTCTVCGPRYSILQKLPYDRETTTMQDFVLCGLCQAEYDDPTNRRYFSQTNSCPDCGVMMQLFDHADHLLLEENEAVLRTVVEQWRSGKIIAVKGIGGYLLTCDATNPTAIETLRTRKHRPTKPFAVLYPNAAVLRADVELTAVALEQLQSTAAPIVLLETRAEPASGLALQTIAPGLSQVGAMLPYAPLFELLLQEFGLPIVATSGNVSQAPIVFEDDRARRDLGGIADFVLTHNRAIVLPQDDSVLTFSQSQRILLRRARGFAPTFIQPNLDIPADTVLAVGAALKSTFTLAHRSNLYISQYIGDLESFDTQTQYQNALQHLLGLFAAKPACIVGDLHPQYFSTQIGQSLAAAWNVPFVQVQHHQAHFAAVLAENDLLQSEKPVLGVIWDGTGLGDDGQIWGGEFFKYESGTFLRCYYFDYFPCILGDKMPREPRIAALAACAEVWEAADWLRPKFSANEWALYEKLITREEQLWTSSVGRIFDAVASLLGLADRSSYEGEAALLLENLARGYFRLHGLTFDHSYFMEGAHYYRIPTATLLRNILMDLRKGKTTDYIAAKFHFSMVHLIKIVAQNLQIEQIAFSGGVFQNALLLDLIQYHLSPDYRVFFHQQLSPNDENISFGQWVLQSKPAYVPSNSR